MTFEILLTLSVLAVMFVCLILNVAGADFILFAAVAVLTLSGVLSPREAVSGFANEGVIVIAFLFIISEALKASGNLDLLASRYLGTTRKAGLSRLLIKMMLPVSFLSAFINNTPIVAIFTPVIKNWAEKIRLPASKFLIPLSYATIFGGTCTLIGTSTNLLSHSLLLQNQLKGFSLFELAWVGIPCTIAGMLYLAFPGKYLLPHRMDAQAHVEKNPKEYVIEMKVPEGSILTGKTIRVAGLRNLKNAYLLDIERRGESIGPVSSSQELQENDHLIFVGLPSGVLGLQEIPGLVPAAHQMFEQDFAKMRTHFVEAVISSTSPILGKTVKECDFRDRYSAGVVAVHRNGERIQDKVGNIRLQVGDVVLLYTDDRFMTRWRESQDFFLVSLVKDRPPVNPGRSIFTLAIAGLMIFLTAIGDWLPKFGLPHITIFHTSMAAVIILMVSKCVKGREIHQALRWEILFAIAFSIGLSHALQTSGTADLIATKIKGATALFSPTILLAIIYFTTVLVTEFLTNNAAVALCFPIALAVAHQLGLDYRPFIIAVTIAASNGFASPLGYQTHLMVQGPGGYKFGDYFRVGLPLDLLIGVIAITAIRLHWPF